MDIPGGAEAVKFMIPAFLFALTVVVFFHELGHFLVARWCGVAVETFSIGFGSEIFGFTDKKGTRWRIAWIPLGGYVKFTDDEDVASRPDYATLERMSARERAGAFHLKPLWQRAAITAAGPVASFLLGIVLTALVMMMFGQQMSTPRIGAVEPGSPAAAAGLMVGDVIVSLDGTPVEAFEDVRVIERSRPDRPLSLTVRRGGDLVTVEATPRSREESFGPWKSRVGWLGITGFIPPKVGSTIKGSPAEAAGLRAGDRIVAIGGTPIESFHDMLRIVTQSADRPLLLEVERGGERFTVEAVPRREEERTAEGVRQVGRLGISPGRDDSDSFRRYYGPVDGLRIGLEQTFVIVEQTIAYIGKVILGRESADQLSGPFGIAYMAGQVAALGFSFLLQLTALLSISIGLFNLFPIPLLDGGHLLYYAIEALRGRPLSERAQKAGFMAGLAIVLMLLVVASYNDMVRLGSVFTGWLDKLGNL